MYIIIMSKHLTSHIPSLTSRYCHPERSGAEGS